MKMVTDTAPASASPSDAPRVSPVTSEPTSAVTGYPASAAPFTDVLSEQTSKALQDGLNKLSKFDKSDKGESAESLASSSPARPTSSSKKSVAVDPSTQPLPLMVPILPPVPVDTAPVRAGVVATPLIEIAQAPYTGQVSVATDSTKDSKASTPPLEADTSTHPGLGEASLPGAAPTKAEPSALPDIPVMRLGENATPSSGVSTKLGENATLPSAASTQGESVIASGIPAARVAELDENVRPLGAGDRSAAPTPVAGPIKLTADQGQSTQIPPQSSGGENVAGAALEARLSQAMSAAADVDAKPEHQRSASTHVASKFADPVGGAISLPLSHSQPLNASVPPFSPMPTSLMPTSDSAVGVSGVNASAHIAQSVPHSLDVGVLAGAISRPLSEGNGSYRVVIAMHPADLGQLQAVVTLHGNDLHVSITPQTQIGRDALANAVDTLKDELSHGGMNVNVTLHDFGSQSRGEDRPQVVAELREPFFPDQSAGISPPPSALAASQIHLIL